jgi:hypothetical protein
VGVVVRRVSNCPLQYTFRPTSIATARHGGVTNHRQPSARLQSQLQHWMNVCQCGDRHLTSTKRGGFASVEAGPRPLASNEARIRSTTDAILPVPTVATAMSILTFGVATVARRWDSYVWVKAVTPIPKLDKWREPQFPPLREARLSG